MRGMKNAFTLMELLVAVTLMVILMGSIIFIFTQSQKTFSRSEQAVVMLQNVRSGFDVMERDLATVQRDEGRAHSRAIRYGADYFLWHRRDDSQLDRVFHTDPAAE